MTEAEGCALLFRLFSEAGYAIAENLVFDEGGVRVELDGWDAERRVGYEYITDEAHDREEFTPRAIDALEARMEKGELFVFLVDEHEAVTRRELEDAARAFLDRVRTGPEETATTIAEKKATPKKKTSAKKRASANKKAATAKKAPAKKKAAAKKKSAAKRPTKRTSAKRPAAKKKPATKRPVAKKKPATKRPVAKKKPASRRAPNGKKR